MFTNKRPKQMTQEEAEVYQQKAIRGLENLGLDDEASDVADLTPEQYAEEKGIQIVNPRRKTRLMANKTELERRIADLEQENEDLQSRLDEILDIAAPEEGDGEEDEGGDGDEGE